MSISEELSRRWFLRLLGGGALTVAIEGCGGDGGATQAEDSTATPRP